MRNNPKFVEMRVFSVHLRIIAKMIVAEASYKAMQNRTKTHKLKIT
jgi:hypothetical protein